MANLNPIHRALTAFAEHTESRAQGVRESLERFADDSALVQRLSWRADEIVEHRELIEAALTCARESYDRIHELERTVDAQHRSRLHWRVLATRAVLGEIGFEEIKQTCLRELLHDFRPEAELEAELRELAARVEAREAALGEFGQLRVIQLDRPPPQGETHGTTRPGPDLGPDVPGDPAPDCPTGT